MILLNRTRAKLPLDSANQREERCSLYTHLLPSLFRSLSPLSYESLTELHPLIYRNREDGGPGKI